MEHIGENASKTNEFAEFEANFIHFCVNLSHIETNSPQEFALIGDVILLLSEIETTHVNEFKRCIKIARKLLPKRILKRIFPKEFDVLPKTRNEMTKQDRDRKELSVGQYKEKYGE